jgi:hypothetical protein
MVAAAPVAYAVSSTPVLACGSFACERSFPSTVEFVPYHAV